MFLYAIYSFVLKIHKEKITIIQKNIKSLPLPLPLPPSSFPMHVGIPDSLMIHHCTVYNPIMIIHLFVMGLDN